MAVQPTARKIAQVLEMNLVRVQICGSLRRGRPVVGDVDMVVSDVKKAMAVAEAWCDMHNGHSFVMRSKEIKKSGSALIDGVQFDMYEASEDQWGAMTMFLTGSANFNIAMRMHAKKLHLKLNQYGVWKGEDLIAARTEELIFDSLGMRHYKPEERDFAKGTHIDIVV
jgi:DNA polymerase (family 10)